MLIGIKNSPTSVQSMTPKNLPERTAGCYRLNRTKYHGTGPWDTVIVAVVVAINSALNWRSHSSMVVFRAPNSRPFTAAYSIPCWRMASGESYPPNDSTRLEPYGFHSEISKSSSVPRKPTTFKSGGNASRMAASGSDPPSVYLVNFLRAGQLRLIWMRLLTALDKTVCARPQGTRRLHDQCRQRQ